MQLCNDSSELLVFDSAELGQITGLHIRSIFRRINKIRCNKFIVNFEMAAMYLSSLIKVRPGMSSIAADSWL